MKASEYFRRIGQSAADRYLTRRVLVEVVLPHAPVWAQSYAVFGHMQTRKHQYKRQAS